MDRFRAMQIFVAVAEKSSFSAAARGLAMSPPAVTRAIAQLEDRIGTPLFKRTTRSVLLTESGARFLNDSKHILNELEEAEAEAVGSHRAPRGELRITAPVLFGRMFVTPILGDFLDQYPLVSCQTLFIDRIVNMMDEGQDVAIRIGELADSSITATRVGFLRRILFASPDYLIARGEPSHPAELSDHRLIENLNMGVSPSWTFQEHGKSFSVRLTSQLRMNTNDAVIELALRGWGISQLLSYQIAPLLAEGKLKTILSDFEMPPLPIHVLHQEGRNVSGRVRAFVDYMVGHLRADNALNWN